MGKDIGVKRMQLVYLVQSRERDSCLLPPLSTVPRQLYTFGPQASPSSYSETSFPLLSLCVCSGSGMRRLQDSYA